MTPMLCSCQPRRCKTHHAPSWQLRRIHFPHTPLHNPLQPNTKGYKRNVSEEENGRQLVSTCGTECMEEGEKATVKLTFLAALPLTIAYSDMDECRPSGLSQRHTAAQHQAQSARFSQSQ